MALRKAVSPLVTFMLSRSSQWRLGKETKAACVSVTVSQQYSRRLAFSQEELQARANFLSKQFQAPQSEMHHFLSCNQQLVTMGREKFQRLSELLARQGISTKELTTYPNIYRRKYETLASRIRQLEEGRVGPITLRMINTTHKKYQAKYGRLILDAEAAERYKSTLHLLSCELGFTDQEAGSVVSESLWLNNTKLSTLREKIQLLRSYGVTSQAIKDRVWVLAFPTSTIRARLDALKGSGLSFQDFPKSYLIAIKSSEDKFAKFQERLVLDKAILSDSGCSDKNSYLCARLSCSPADVEAMVKKFPALMSVRLPKLKASLDLLIQEFGVQPSVIREWPRVLGLGSDTLSARLRQLQDHNVPVSGRALYLSNQDYERFIAKLDTSV